MMEENQEEESEPCSEQVYLRLSDNSSDDNETCDSSSGTVFSVLDRLPSSTASERPFSLLNSSFNDQQHQSLQDYVEASI